LKRKSIYLIRHGETDLNRKGVVQGSGVDSMLNEWGEAQAAAFFNAYQHVPFDKIYTSALQRTQQSVRGFINQGIPYESYAGLYEISSSTAPPKKGKVLYRFEKGRFLL
jgi:bisphosphoglycerate-dependent phosphoglycerate mutase